MTTIEYIKSKIKGNYECAIVLGSGWDEVANIVKKECVIDYVDIPNYPTCTVQGHTGQMVFGTLKGKKVILLKGRFHLYEGYSVQEVVKPMAVMKELGVKTIILTNASGGLNASFASGDVMIITDHINHSHKNPLVGIKPTAEYPVFTDMSEVYTKKLVLKTSKICDELGIRHHEGVYLQVLGPTYETPAETYAFRNFGADAVGMSTVLEAIMAHYLKMDIIGLSLITNMACGISDEKTSHKDVLKTAHDNKKKLSKLIENVVTII